MQSEIVGFRGLFARADKVGLKKKAVVYRLFAVWALRVCGRIQAISEEALRFLKDGRTSRLLLLKGNRRLFDHPPLKNFYIEGRGL